MSLRMAVTAGVIVRMRVSILLVVRMGVMFPKELIGDQVIFSETLVMSMTVPATVGALFGL